MGLTLLSQPAQAVFITVNSTQYDVRTFTGSYSANISQFATPANGGLMPWYGNQTLANQFALAVYAIDPSLTGNSFSRRGPYFAYQFNPAAGPSPSSVSVSSISLDTRTGYPVVSLAPTTAPTGFNGVSYATATAVPWETDALPVIGSTLLFAAGVWTKRKLAKPLNKD